MVAMPDQPIKLNANLQNLRVDTAPTLNVTPVLQRGGSAPDPLTAMQQAITTLQAQNDKLLARVAELEKSMVAVRLILQGVDPALNTVSKKVDDLRAEYTVHEHELPFSYQPFSVLKDGGDRDFLIAYIWEGQHQNWTPLQQHQDAMAKGATTGKPQPKP